MKRKRISRFPFPPSFSLSLSLPTPLRLFVWNAAVAVNADSSTTLPACLLNFFSLFSPSFSFPPSFFCRLRPCRSLPRREPRGNRSRGYPHFFQRFSFFPILPPFFLVISSTLEEVEGTRLLFARLPERVIGRAERPDHSSFFFFLGGFFFPFLFFPLLSSFLDRGRSSAGIQLAPVRKAFPQEDLSFFFFPFLSLPFLFFSCTICPSKLRNGSIEVSSSGISELLFR